MSDDSFFDEDEDTEGWEVFEVRGCDTGYELDDPEDRSFFCGDIRASTQLYSCDECEKVWLYLVGGQCDCGTPCAAEQPFWRR